jgi:hypothetical protein
MLLPLTGFVLGCIAFTFLGAIVLACIPAFRLTVLNLVGFVVGGFLGALVFLFAYGQIFAKHQLGNTAFAGIFPVLLLGAVLGGTATVWLWMRFTKTQAEKS